MTTLLTWLKEEFDKLGLPYALERWTGELRYPCFVGGITAQSHSRESGRSNGTFTLNGWSQTSVEELLDWNERLYEHFASLHTVVDEVLVWVRYQGAQVIPTGEDGLYRLQTSFVWVTVAS